MKKTTPTCWWRKQRTAGTNITKTAGQVGHNHNSRTAGRYNTKKTQKHGLDKWMMPTERKRF
jgi:hypothetical protein